MLYLQKSWKVA